MSLPGFLQNPYPYVKHASLLVQPSDGKMPTVLIEALYLGTPIVATDCPGRTREILMNGQYGRIVPVNSPEALALAMEETLGKRTPRPAGKLAPVQVGIRHGPLPGTAGRIMNLRRIAYVLSLLFIFLVPWEDSISTSGWGSLARLAGLVLAACWFATILIEGRFRTPHLFHFLVLLFFMWNFVSVYWSFDATGTVQRITTYSQMFLVMLVFWEMFQKPEQEAALQAFVLGGYALVAGTFYSYLNGLGSIWEGRYSAPGVNAVDMALTLVIALPMALHLFLEGGPGRANKLLKWVNLAYIPAATFAVILSGSRTSLIAVIPFFFYIMLTPQIKLQGKMLAVAGCLLVLAALLPFIPSSSILP